MTFYSGATIPYRDSVQAYLKDVGIDFKPETVTQARQTDLENKGWQNGAMNVFTSVGVPTMDPSTALYNSVASMGNRYVSLYHPKEVDDKIAQALVEFDLNKRKALIQDLGYLIIDKYSLVTPIYLAPNNCVMSKAIKIHDLRLSEAPYPRWRPDIAWIEK
jgi:ABC-type transport system substrate-binding protein